MKPGVWPDSYETTDTNVDTIEVDVTNVGARLSVRSTEIMALDIVTKPVRPIFLKSLDEVSS